MPHVLSPPIILDFVASVEAKCDRGRDAALRRPRTSQRDVPTFRTLLLRRERGDDFFEARIAAERVPVRVQTKPTIV